MSKPTNKKPIGEQASPGQGEASKSRKADKSAMTGLFLDQQTSLKAFISRFIRRPQDIDDIAQETFVRAFLAEQKSAINSPKAYLYRIARNLSLETLSKKSARMTQFIEDSCEESVLKNLEDVEDRVDVLKKFDRLKRGIAELPPQCQRVFIMHKVYGFKYREISKQLGISVSTVEKHIMTGLKRCRDSVNQKEKPQTLLDLAVKKAAYKDE